MRIRGRRLYPSTLAERRVMMSLGGVPLYAPRGISPYLVARRLSRLASAQHTDATLLRDRFRSRQASGKSVAGLPAEHAETMGAPKPVAA